VEKKKSPLAAPATYSKNDPNISIFPKGTANHIESGSIDGISEHNDSSSEPSPSPSKNNRPTIPELNIAENCSE